MADPECTLRDVRLLLPNWKGVALSLGVSALAIIGGIVAIALAGVPQGEDGGAFMSLLMLFATGGGVGTMWFGRFARRPSGRAAELRATGNGVYLDGKRIVARKDIASAVLWPGRDTGAYVRVTRRGLGAPIDLQVRSADDGRRLIHALGLSAAQTATELSMSSLSLDHMKSKIRGSWLGGATLLLSVVAAVIAGKNGLGPPAGLIAVAGLLFHVAMMVRMTKQATITVGADGVHVRWFQRQRFIPILDIERAEVVEGDAWATMLPMVVRIHTRDGNEIDLVGRVGRTSTFGSFNQGVRMQAEVIAERINDAVRAREAAPGGEIWDDSLLSRGEREVGEWVALLRRLEDKAQTFRQRAPVSTLFERLWAILEDAGATPTRRAAAAVALSPHLDDEGRERLRIAAQATATPKLRIALEAAAEDDDDRLILALDEVAAVEEARAAGG